MHSWFKQLKQEWILPEIHPERCVHSQCEIASCTNCIDACPHAAWLLDDGSLSIDTSRCDGCGLCVAACTESALIQKTELLTGQLAGKPTLLAACEYADSKLKGQGVIPCLYLMTPALLAEFYSLGYQELKFTSGDCNQCVRQQSCSLTTSFEQLNQLLASRAVPLLKYQALGADAWKKQRAALKVTYSYESTQTRRQFLKQAVNLAVEHNSELKDLSTTPKSAQTWLTALPTSSDSIDRLYPITAQINPLRCNACHACVQLCPHQALSLVKLSDKTLFYQTTPEQCTGCQLCIDACDQQAISLKTYSIKPEPINLELACCKACGSPFNYPSIQETQVYCRICSKTQHHRQLFQVYS